MAQSLCESTLKRPLNLFNQQAGNKLFKIVPVQSQEVFAPDFKAARA
jgi:hypothetical protein